MVPVYSIENPFLEVKIKRKGAELCSVVNKSGFEFMWQAQEVWPRHAPNLFPIVGSLLDHQYEYDGKMYTLSHHGFARDMEFDMLHQSEHSICFVLQHTEQTLLSYPFRFTLLLTYTLSENSLIQKFRVINEDDKAIPTSFGGHPAFNAKPVSEYKIVFSEQETTPSNQLSGPYIGVQEIDVIDHNIIALDESTFDDDALVFQGLRSNMVTLQHTNSNHSVEVDISDFPYLGIWAKPGAPYVCIEPWQGLADLETHDKNITNKRGIIWVDKEQELSKSFRMKFNA